MFSRKPLTWITLAAILLLSAAAPRGPAVAAASDVDATARDRALYAGTWKIVAVESNGETKAQRDREVVIVNRVDGSWSMTVDGLEVNRGESRIDPLASPPEIDVEITDGDGRGSVLKAIYEVGDSRRRLCFRGEQGWRPREFRTQPGDCAVLVTFEKVPATAPLP